VSVDSLEKGQIINLFVLIILRVVYQKFGFNQKMKENLDTI
jgi:hypothetical protein